MPTPPRRTAAAATCATLLALVLSIVPGMQPTHAEETRRPNIVVILADDLGYGDLSSYGNDRYQTPRLDAMAAAGMRFTDFHSNGSVCSPTRAALLTGRYQQRAGLGRVVKAGAKHPTHFQGIQDSETTIAEALKEAGYATGIIGKWHLGYQPQYNPTRHGFDEFRGYISGNIDFQSHVDEAGRLDWWRNTEIEDEPGYVTDLITQHAIDFVDRHQAAPFFLYVAHQSPHYPYQGPNDPALREVNGKKQSRPKDEIPQAYKEMMESMDAGVGQLLDALHERGLAENTLVLFMSDNGATKSGNNGGLRGQKGHVFEAGHRVPCIAYWPGKVEAGSETSALTMTFDVMPTALELAGVKSIESLQLDGRSLMPVLEGEAVDEPRAVYWSQNARWAMRSGPWKYVRLQEKQETREFLFNLDKNRNENKNRIKGNAGRAKRMSTELDRWLEEVTATATPQPDNPNAN